MNHEYPNQLPATLPPGTRAANGILLLTEGQLVPYESSYTACVRFEGGREMLAGLHARVIDWGSVVGGAEARPSRLEAGLRAEVVRGNRAERAELQKPHPWECDE